MELMAPALIADGVAIAVTQGQNILASCLEAGLEVPYFCWHPALGSVGACRQCAVKVFVGPEDQTGQIVMACMTRAAPNMRVAVADPDAQKFREQVIEFVLTNHPHDCPVCEVGGECHLQDMAVLTGHSARRYRFTKRSHLNQNLGPLIRHEMNRCIGCYRCVRFYRDYAGGDDFGVFGANQNIYFGRAEDGALENPFAGNLVEVCPTGVFVDKPFSARFARKWDLRSTPAVCPHCAVGCNINVQERNGELRRVTNRYNATLNGYFLCDRGRFGTGFVASPKRLRSSRRGREILDPATVPAALERFLQHDKIIGIGSPRASVEANFTLREVVGAENFYAGLAAPEYDNLTTAIAVMRQHGEDIATMDALAQADAILILGDDPVAIAPVLGLALRQAARRAGTELLGGREIPAWHADAAKRAKLAQATPFVIVTPAPTGLDGMATAIYRQKPAWVTQFAFAIAHAIDPAAPAVQQGEAAAIAELLTNARHPVVVAAGAACGSALLQAAGNITRALQHAGVAVKLSLLVPECNSLGLGLMAPRPLAEALTAIADSHVLVIENDLHRRIDAAGLGLAVCVLDHVKTATAEAAEIALAVGSFADGDGTTVNLEGRAQRSFKAIFGRQDPPQSWTLLRDAGIAAGRLQPGRWATHRDLLADIEARIPALVGCAAASPSGVTRPASLPYRYSGRTAESADYAVREDAPPVHSDSPFGTTMEGPRQLRSPGWNSAQAINGGRLPELQNSGAFLFDAVSAPSSYVAPPGLAPDAAGLVFIPALRVFGGEELSAFSPAIAARMQPPSVTLAPLDAQHLSLHAGDWVICETGRSVWHRRLVIDLSMAAGVAAIDTGLPGEMPLAAAVSGSIRRAP
jgi:NADH-quinone oxidoreductase subunit G